jgi:hypothetical protein
MVLTNEILAPLPREERIRRLKAGVADLYGNPSGAQAAYMNGFLSVFFADSRTAYEPRDPVPLPIALVKAEVQLRIRHGETAGMRRLRDEPSAGWERYSRGSVRVCVLPGNHNSILLERNAGGVAEFLKKCLDELNETKRHI